MFLGMLKRIYRRFMNDFVRRLLALALALFVWAWINLEVSDEADLENITVKVEYDSALMKVSPDNFVIHSLRVRYQGSDKENTDWRLPTKYKLVAKLPEDLKGEGKYSFLLKDLHLDVLPEGVTLKSMRPESLNVAYDMKVSEKKDIQFPRNQTMPNGDVIKFTLATPSAKINVSGPYSIVHKLQALQLEEPDLSQLDKSDIVLRIVNPDPRNVTLNPASISFQLDRQRLGERSYEQIPFLLLPRNSDLVLVNSELPTVRVRLRGSEWDLEELGKPTSTLRAYLDMTEVVEAGDYREIEVRVCGLPKSGVDVVSIDPDKIHDIVLRRRESAEHVSPQPGAVEQKPEPK